MVWKLVEHPAAFAAAQIGDIAVGVLGIDPDAYLQMESLTFTTGDPVSAFQALKNERAMIINGILATASGIQVGDEVELVTPTGKKTYRVVGLATDYLNAKTTTAYISQTNIALDFGRQEDVFFQINLKPNADREKVESALMTLLKDYPQFKLLNGKRMWRKMPACSTPFLSPCMPWLPFWPFLR